MTRKSFTFRTAWYEAVRNQPDHIRLALFDAITRYAIDGEIPDRMDPIVEIAFMLIRAEIDAAPKPRKKAEKQPAEPIPAPKPESEPKPEPQYTPDPEPQPKAEFTPAPQPEPPVDSTPKPRQRNRLSDIYYDLYPTNIRDASKPKPGE